MKKLFRIDSLKFLSMVITAMFLSLSFPFSRVSAEEALSLSLSGNQEVGSSITISAVLSGSGPYSGFDGFLNYDDKILSLISINAGDFDAANFQVSGSKFLVYNTTIPGGSVIITATFSCVAEGVSDVAIQLNSLGDMNGQDIPVTPSSIPVTVTTPVPKSSEARLAALNVSPGELSPAFSPDKYEYSVQVSSEVSQITVSATAQDDKATISLNGVQDKLVAGVNNVTVTVTAEDGSTRIYKIAVTRSEGPTPTPTPTPKPLPVVYIDNDAYTILTAGANDGIPEGFAATTVLYSDTMVPALIRGYGEAQDSSELVLMFLTNDTASSYFVFDRQSQEFYPYISMQMSPDSYVYAGEAPETMIPTGYEPFNLSFYDQNIIAYRLRSAPDHLQCLLYLMSDSGVSSFYIYDQEVKLIIPYRGEVILLTPTPIPTPTSVPTLTPIPTLPVNITQTPQESALNTNQGIEEPASSSVKTEIPALLNFQNPVALLFFLLCLIVLVLIVLLILLFVRNRSFKKQVEVTERKSCPDQTSGALMFSKGAKREKAQRTRDMEYEDPDLYYPADTGVRPVHHPIIFEPDRNRAKSQPRNTQDINYPPVFEKKNPPVKSGDKPTEPLRRPGNSSNPAENKKQDTTGGLLFGDPDDE